MERQKLKISYSRLSDYDRNGASALLEKPKKESIALKKGSLINDLLFGNVDFNEHYVMKIYEKPTATLLKLANIIIENYVKIPTTEGILEIIKNNEFWSGTKLEKTIIKNFDRPEFWEYLEIEMGVNGKTAVTPTMKIQADEIVNTLRTHKYSKELFSEAYELKSEIVFSIDYEDVILRGIVDIVQLDHKNKTIRLIDLKTGGDEAGAFETSFVKWRYYLQEAVYMLAADEIKKQLGVEDYKVLNFQFLYIGLREKIPVLFNVDELWHNSALYGFTTESGYIYKGLFELIREVKYHWENKVFDIPYVIHKSKGNVKLRSSFIKSNV